MKILVFRAFHFKGERVNKQRFQHLVLVLVFLILVIFYNVTSEGVCYCI